MRPASQSRPGGASRRTCRAAAALALAWVATVPLAAAEYFRADRFGTPLEPLAGNPGPGAGFVLAVDTVAEAEAAGLEARRRLLQGGATVHEWRRTAADEGSLEQELEECLEHLQRLSQRLNNPEFTGKAPAEVVDRERGRMEGLEERRNRIREFLSQLG